jgi:hypothetical protein
MLLASIVILFSLLALCLLVLMDRHEAAALKIEATRRNTQAEKFNYYDAFTDRRQNAGAELPAGRVDRRKAAA